LKSSSAFPENSANTFARYVFTRKAAMINATANWLFFGRKVRPAISDIEREGWLEMLKLPSFQQCLREVNVFVASHHGRENGYCEEVFQYCTPDIVVISDRRHTIGYKKDISRDFLNASSFETFGFLENLGEVQRKMPNDNGSISAALMQVVRPAATIAISSSVNPSVVGRSVTFTATLSPSAATGTVTFLDGKAALITNSTLRLPTMATAITDPVHPP
jgi:hypothetical protein